MDNQKIMQIASVMKYKGYSKYKLAKKLGIPYSVLHDYCSGKSKNCKYESVILEYLGLIIETKIIEKIC